MTGRAPVPVPMTSRLHFHGIFSSAESGVWPKASRNFLDGFFLRLRTCPRSMSTSCSYVTPSMRIEPKENASKRQQPAKVPRLSFTVSTVFMCLLKCDMWQTLHREFGFSPHRTVCAVGSYSPNLMITREGSTPESRARPNRQAHLKRQFHTSRRGLKACFL